MDLAEYLREDLALATPQCSQDDDRGKLKERFENHALEIHQLTNEVFAKLVYQQQLDASIQAIDDVLSKLSKNMTQKVLHQNQLSELINAELEKYNALQLQAIAAKEKVEENGRKIVESRRCVDEFGEYAAKFHDSIRCINSEISDMEEEVRRYREKENELLRLNVGLANAETELSEADSSIQVTELQIAKYNACNQKCCQEIEALMVRKQEIEASLAVHLEEKLKMQRELEGFAVEAQLNEKLDDIDVVLERHASIMSKVEAEHEAAMLTLQQEMQAAVERNEAFKKLLEDLDGTLAEQHEAMDRAKEQQEAQNCSFADDPELGPLSLELQDLKCKLNQVEEETRYMRNQLSSTAMSQCSSKGSMMIASPRSQPPSAFAVVDDREDAMTTLKTSTPQLILDGFDLSSVSGVSGRPPSQAPTLSSIQDISYASNVSQAASKRPSSSVRSQRRTPKRTANRVTLDQVTSSSI